MATTRLMTTVLPHSVSAGAAYHLSLFFTHRLVPDAVAGGAEAAGTLADFPAIVDWPGSLSRANVALRINNSPNPVACTLQTAAINPAAWAAAFPSTTLVTGFPRSTLASSAPWRSFPASAMPDHGLDAHYSSVFSSPVTPPAVGESRLATAVLEYFGTIDGAGPLVDEFVKHRRNPDGHRRNIERAGRERAEATRDGCDCSDGEPLFPQQDSLLGKLLDRPAGQPPMFETFDRAVTAHLDGLLHPAAPDGPAGPNVARRADSPVQKMLLDSHAAAEYYRRPEQPAPLPLAPGEKRPRPDKQQVEFHALAAAAGNTPALARSLGFVVDVKLEDPSLLAGATSISCEVTIPGVQTLLSPLTECTTIGEAFMATTGADTRWESGFLTVGLPEYRVLDLDPDAAGLKLEQHLRGVARAQAAEFNGDGGNFAPATLRSNGFAIANTRRVTNVRGTVGAAEARRTDVLATDPGATPQRFGFGELVRGLQVQVWDDHTRRWHSLHERRVTVDVNGTVVLSAVPDTGMLQGAAPSRVPGAAANPYYLHEVVAGWDGWSLSAARPGLNIVHDSGQGADPGSEVITDGVEDRPGTFRVQSSAAPGTLPALRYGRRYAFRILGVDLAGNVVAHSTETTDPAVIDAATVAAADAHLKKLRQETENRDSTGLLMAQRPATAPGQSPRGLVGRVHDAMARIERTAATLKVRPHLGTRPPTSRHCSHFRAAPTRSPHRDRSCAGTPSLNRPWCRAADSPSPNR